MNLSQDSSSRPHLPKENHNPPTHKLLFIWPLKGLKVKRLLLSNSPNRNCLSSCTVWWGYQGPLWSYVYFFFRIEGTFLSECAWAKVSTVQFIYSVLSHTCLDMGCFLVLKIACLANCFICILSLSLFFCCKCFLLNTSCSTNIIEEKKEPHCCLFLPCHHWLSGSHEFGENTEDPIMMVHEHDDWCLWIYVACFPQTWHRLVAYQTCNRKKKKSVSTRATLLYWWRKRRLWNLSRWKYENGKTLLLNHLLILSYYGMERGHSGSGS